MDWSEITVGQEAHEGLVEITMELGMAAVKLQAERDAALQEVERLRRALAGHLFDGESVSAREAVRSELVEQLTRAEDRLRLVARGRRAYADNAPEPSKTNLEREAQAYDNALGVIRGDPDTLRALLPSWMWDAADVDL